jgi:hypothetical protein
VRLHSIVERIGKTAYRHLGIGSTSSLLPAGFGPPPHIHHNGVSESGPATMLQITSPAQFERFAAEMGEPAQTMTLPEPRDVDVEKLLAIVPSYGIEMLPPSPG